MNVEIGSKNSSMGAAARGLCGLLLALAALLWLPAQAAAAPCHGAIQEAPAATTGHGEVPATSVAAAITNSTFSPAATAQAFAAPDVGHAMADCCNGGDCGGCGCAVAALPVHAFASCAVAPVADYAVSPGRRPSLSLPELFRPPIPA